VGFEKEDLEQQKDEAQHQHAAPRVGARSFEKSEVASGIPGCGTNQYRVVAQNN
jgi:hypothetical protein